MKFSIPATVVALSFALSSSSTPMVKRATPTPEQCSQSQSQVGLYHGNYSPACVVLSNACVNQLASDSVPDEPWLSYICVAAATCQGTTTTIGVTSCVNDHVANTSPENLAAPDIAVWSGHIETTCNTAPPRCTATRQQYIDFIYRTLDELNSSVWPDAQSEVIDIWWKALQDFAGRSDDLLGYSDMVNFLRTSNS